MDNPFTLTFGTEPNNLITRTVQVNKIRDSFLSEKPSSSTYMIMGVRGSGKTVLLTNIAEDFKSRSNWVVLHISPESDNILNSIAAKLYSRPELSKLFINARIDISQFGIGVSLRREDRIFDIETALERMLEALKKRGMRLLIVIDEIVKNEQIIRFASNYQIFLQNDLPVFLIMTGLYNNIRNLQNERSLTFLYRAPRLLMDPLNLLSISRSYASVLQLDQEKAMEMARLTMGYAYAYQVLGYLYWENYVAKNGSGTIDAILDQYDELLSEYVYEKIWYELSETEKMILSVIIHAGKKIRISEIREQLSLSHGEMSVYRDRLKKKGLVDVSSYGYLSLALPRFGEIVQLWMED